MMLFNLIFKKKRFDCLKGEFWHDKTSFFIILFFLQHGLIQASIGQVLDWLTELVWIL